MLIDLDGPTIVSSFKQNLPNFAFIAQSDISNISTQLDKLADLTVRKGKPFIYSRTGKTDAAIWLWDYFVNHALSSITTNTRGYHELHTYFKHYAHYENVLFSLDENHRDHVIHSIWVMMIGFYLCSQCRPLSHLSYHPFCVIGDQCEHPDSMEEAIRIFYDNQDALWTLISLTHDLGYPIQKTTLANDVMSKMISNFGFLTQTKFSYEFTVLHQTAIDELLNTLSTTINWFPDGHYKLGIEPGTRLDYSKTFERLDHGIMSAYLIQRYLDFICDTMSWLRDIPEYSEHNSQMAALRAFIISWLSAISDHTNNSKYFDDLDDISVLLIMSDELDEFSRYAHHRKRDTWVRVKCKPSVNCTQHSLDFVYQFVGRTQDETVSLFRGKIRRLIDRFDLNQTSVRKVSIKCSNPSRKPQDNCSYYFERRFGPGYGFVKKAYGSSSTDVRGFLDGVVNLD
jgi:hypothetical protein